MNVQVDRLTSAHVLSILEPRWNSNPKLARSLRQRLSLIGAWIVAQGYLQTNPAGEVLDGVLPRRKPPVRHFASTPSHEAAAALAALEALDTPAALAIRFAILTATRSNEIRGARWTEIDLDDALWTVPTERTKMRRPHRVPLSTAALAVVEEARTLPASDDLVFPSRQGQIIHHSTIALALRTAGLDTTLHGFRATFRSWALENGEDWAASELALAHELGNAVTQAYARSDMLDRRRGLMERWGQHLVTRQIEDALIHAPADSGKPQPLEDSPGGYEDFTRESTGSDVSQPATAPPNAVMSRPDPEPTQASQSWTPPVASDGWRYSASQWRGPLLDHRRRLPLRSSASLRTRAYFAARCSGVWSSGRSCSRTRLCVLPLTTLETVSRRKPDARAISRTVESQEVV